MKVIYRCEDEGCTRHGPRDFDTAEACLAHEAQKLDEPLAKVGDIVLLGHCFGWFNGDKRWISNPNVGTRLEVKRPCPNGDGNCFGSCCNYEFYWVVTAIDVYEHRLRYHCASRAITSERKPHEPICGWTRPDTHYRPRLVADPPKEVVESSKELLGLKYDNLL